jgi:hypothetical protein
LLFYDEVAMCSRNEEVAHQASGNAQFFSNIPVGVNKFGISSLKAKSSQAVAIQ